MNDFFFDFFYSLEKILGFSSFILMHRADEDIIVKGSTLQDIYIKSNNPNIFKAADVDFLAKDLDSKVYTAIDFKFFTREGLYLTDFFIIFFFYFMLYFFLDYLPD